MRKIIFTSIAITFVGCGSAFASGAMAPVAPAHPGGWLIGIDGGYGQLSTLQGNLRSDWVNPDYIMPEGSVYSQNHDIGEFVWGGYLGREFNLSENALLGLELGYKNLGKSTYNYFLFQAPPVNHTESWNIKIDQQAVDLLLTGKYFIYSGLNVFAKAGVALVDATTKQNYLEKDPQFADRSYNYDKSFWQLEPEIALGFGYSFASNWDVHLMYDYVHGTDGNVMNNNDETVFSPAYKQTRTYESNSVFLGVSYSIN